MDLTIRIPDDTAARLQAQAQARGLTVDRWLLELVVQSTPGVESAPAKPAKPLASRLRDVWADMPAEVRAKLPVDGASQHDHYIYGVPKREL